MIAALTLLVMSGLTHSPQPVVRAQPAVVRPAARTAPATSTARMTVPMISPVVLEAIAPDLQEAVVCSAHMELLMEKLSARGESADAPVILIEDYWLSKLPDPDGPEAISVEAFVNIKDILDGSASTSPSQYLSGLQDCVISAARGGALAD